MEQELNKLKFEIENLKLHNKQLEKKIENNEFNNKINNVLTILDDIIDNCQDTSILILKELSTNMYNDNNKKYLNNLFRILDNHSINGWQYSKYELHNNKKILKSEIYEIINKLDSNDNNIINLLNKIIYL
jgi:hypothetical protein